MTTKLATESEVQLALLGLRGIFWALDLLVVQHAADALVDDHEDGIENLIVAGKVLADEISRRF